MLNTLKSMYSMISDVSADEPVGMIAEKASAGAIMGARGNSGVILSQIIHGISRGLRGKRQRREPKWERLFSMVFYMLIVQ